MTKLLPGLSVIANDHDAILCDVWGVIHDGSKPFIGAVDALRRFRTTRGPVVLVTNAPVPEERVRRVFTRLGVPDDCFDAIVTSGDATRHELARLAPGPVYPIGIPDDVSVYAGLPLAFTDDPAKARVICCTSLRDYPGGEPAPYRPELKLLASHGLAMICANPDVQFRLGDRLIWAAGALARIYEEVGGEVLRPGKPDAPIYRFAMERAAALAGAAIPHARVLAIGDGPATDILGANRQGFASVFIGEGIHAAAMADGDDFIDTARGVLSDAGVKADWAQPRLIW